MGYRVKTCRHFQADTKHFQVDTRHFELESRHFLQKENLEDIYLTFTRHLLDTFYINFGADTQHIFQFF